MKLRDCLFCSLSVLLVGVLLQLPIVDCQLSIEKSAFHKSTIKPVKATAISGEMTPNAEMIRGRKRLVSQAYGKLPLSFETNRGQVNDRVKFLSRGNGHSLFLTSTEAVLEWSIADGRSPIEESGTPNERWNHSRQQAVPSRQSSTLRMKLSGTNPQAQATGLDELPGKSNYFLGRDPRKWQTNIPRYAKIKFKEVYPGIDLLYYGNQRGLEYDFIVAPGADPKAIKLSFQGARKLELTPGGELVLHAAGGQIRQLPPIIYQEEDGVRLRIPGHYVLQSANHVGFQVGAYDPSKPLIIDPVLVYSTYLGGSRDEDHWGDLSGAGIAVDTSGNVYLTGVTRSTDFPIANPLQPASLGSENAFVVKLNAAGSALAYSTYLGGSDGDSGAGIDVDADGNSYVTGLTFSNNFPTTPGALQPALNGPADAFVAKLNSTGSALIYSTYLGGSSGEQGYGIALDVSGNAYIAGGTASTNFPTANPWQPANHGFLDAFVAKLNPTGSTLVYSTYLGGNDYDEAHGIAVDPAGNAYVTGRLLSTDFPTQSAFQGASGGNVDAFVTKLNAAGAPGYSTYLGGSSRDEGFGIAVDAAGNAYVTGTTRSTNFPSANPIQAANAGGIDAFVAKLNAAGSALAYSTYVGGTNDDEGFGIAVDSGGNAHVTGETDSTNFPTANPIQATSGGGRDAFLTKLNAAGSALVYSTYLGGSGEENYFSGDLTRAAVAVDSSGNAYVTGATCSADFPVANPFQAAARGGEQSGSDLFVAKISGSDTPIPYGITLFVPIILSSSGANNSFFTSELVLTNRGSKDATLEFTYTAAFGGGSGTAFDTLRAGRQQVIPDAISYLKSIGIPLPDSGNRGGTLVVRFSGLSSSSVAAATVRTTTVVDEGRAGLAYAGIPTSVALTGPAYLCGLRQNATDRSNVALVNAGAPGEGNVVLRLTVFSGNPGTPFSQALPDENLSPGGFKQIDAILTSHGMSLNNGYVRVERVGGTAPYYAYAVINDQANSDGSFVPSIPEQAMAGRAGLTLPVIVETSSFISELVMTNWSVTTRTLRLAYVSEAVQARDSTANFSVTLKPGEQSIIPNLVQYLREQGVSGVGTAGPSYVGALTVLVDGDASGVFLGARTSTAGRRGRYGLFYVGVPYGQPTTATRWLYGLQQNAETRTNLALINSGEMNFNPDVFQIELFDGDTGLKVSTIEGITLSAQRWLQMDTILAQHAPGTSQGYARVTRTAGSTPFIAYGVINDGGQPGQRSGDGAFVASSP